MKYDNPTPLRLGMSGTFAGIRYTVKGRSVMSVNDAGATYYWNEFRLAADDGTCATLVYEQTEGGEEWRLFRLIDPAHPISAEQAAMRRVGETIDITGTPLRISLVDESRVCHIEGEAPEGEDVGDVAKYFNAEGGNEMIVVSWTGSEVEFYRGINLPSNAVADAFKLLVADRRFMLSPIASKPPSSNLIAKLVVPLFLFAVFAFIAFQIWRPAHHRAQPQKPKPPPAPLAMGATGKLDGRGYRIASHTVVEVGEVGSRYRRNEYQLMDGADEPALLIQGSRANTGDWLLCVPFQPRTPLTPFEAAAKRQGDYVQIDTPSLRVMRLFRTTMPSLEKPDPSSWSTSTSPTFYGFFAQGEDKGPLYLVRWTETGITYFHVKPLPAKMVTTAFKR